jgi:hypothetical protein
MQSVECCTHVGGATQWRRSAWSVSRHTRTEQRRDDVPQHESHLSSNHDGFYSVDMLQATLFMH